MLNRMSNPAAKKIQAIRIRLNPTVDLRSRRNRDNSTLLIINIVTPAIANRLPSMKIISSFLLALRILLVLSSETDTCSRFDGV